MNQPSNQSQPLALPRTDIVGKTPFTGDLLGRKKLASQLTNYLDRLRVGAVLAIDAPWGEGKTWFGRNWAKDLQSEEHQHKVVFIDAFAMDYVEDPFLLIAAEIADVLNDDRTTAKKLRTSAAAVMKAILPVSGKFLINVAGRVALGTGGLSEDIEKSAKSASDGVADATGKWLEKKLENHSKEKTSIEHFRTALAEFAASQPKPVIVFIDELDRCRPAFAVQLIERIKHFFDVPNLIFVLLLNRTQLENAIKGVYGSGIDAQTYLGKFIHLFLHLPKDVSRNAAFSEHYTSTFIKNALGRYGFTDSQRALVDSFAYDLSHWVINLDLSLRDIERACALFVMANASNTGLIAYLIALKLKIPDLYSRLTTNDKSAHNEAANLIAKFIGEKSIDRSDWPDIYFACLQETHQLQAAGTGHINTPFLEQYANKVLGHRGFQMNRTFSEALNRLDLPLEVR